MTKEIIGMFMAKTGMIIFMVQYTVVMIGLLLVGDWKSALYWFGACILTLSMFLRSVA